MAGRDIPVHRLRPNEKVWSPPSVIVLDTESRWVTVGEDECHTLRLWAATHVDRRKVRKRAGPVAWGWGGTPGDLAAWIDGRCKGRETVWLYAHNLNFDLVTSNLVEGMAGHGWRVKDFSVTVGAPWLRLGKDRRTLTVCDSWSWLPESVESLSHLVGVGKLPLPAGEDGEWAWLGRAATDVDITARALLGLMDWWDERQLGRWTISGAGCGWNAMRHIDSPQRHVIDVTPDLVAQDRLAVRGGRRDAAVLHADTGGPFVELDLERAYTVVCRDLPLPIRRGWAFQSMPLDSKQVGGRFYGLVADCLIRCDRPRYPMRWRGVTWFPVGEFRTVLAGPEIAWARDNGDLVEIGPGQAHRLGYALQPWATWVLDPSEGGTVNVPPVGMVACKAWGRSVVGKFAAHARAVEQLEGTVPAGWTVQDQWDRTTRTKGADVTMGGQRFLATFDLDTENCYPAVFAWVQSEVRVRLGKVLEALDGLWWTCDTDGLLIDLANARHMLRFGQVRLGVHARDAFGLAQSVCDQVAALVAPLTLRPKRVFDSLRVLGPQHLHAGDERRYSGVAKTATETVPGTFVARDWPGLKWQMNHSRPGVYVRPRREITFAAPTVHRWVLPDGTTRPPEARIAPDGTSTLVPWSEGRWAAAGDVLAESQYRLLDRLR